MSTTSPLEYGTRIRALERINATLAAEIDRMRPVVEAVEKLVRADDSGLSAANRRLYTVFADYEAARQQRA